MNEITGDLVDVAALMLDGRIGLKRDESFRPRLIRALRDVGRVRHLDADGLMAAIVANASVVDDLLDHVTVQETAFFRHPEQFEMLTAHLLPSISGAVHIWSAASANGQEPYSLAMSLREAGRLGTVLATDVARPAVRRTLDAVYDEREVRSLSRQRLDEHFARDADTNTWQVQRAVRDLVTTRWHNLLAPIPSEVAHCQIVFCRNVLIYFSASHAGAFLDRLADVMAPDAHLVVGAAETIWHVNERFEAVELGSCYAYRRRSRSSQRSAQRALLTTAVATGLGVAAPRDRPPRPKREAIAQGPVTQKPSGAVEVELAGGASAAGTRLLAAGASDSAVTEFRRWAFSEPDDPLAHFHLATALVEAGHAAAAQRAFRTALFVLDEADPAALDRTLKGFDVDELRRLLVTRSRPSSGQPKRDIGRREKEGIR